LESQIKVSKGFDISGYFVGDTFRTFIWTGINGTGWNEIGIWDYQGIPRFRHNVFIPAGLTNYPKFNARLFTIG
jgi:hypothetical protein